MNICHIRAYAKINLGLDVTGRRADGYHKVKMVMQTVDIYDELTMERTKKGILLTTDSGELTTDEKNLVHKAARLMLDEFSIGGGIRVHLQKNIPVAAGMAGGSTDAAATMRGMNELYGIGASDERLRELGLRIGADVPYCIMGGTALAEGIGEKLTQLPPAPQCVVLIAKPEAGVSTKYVYEHLDAKEGYAHPDIDGMVAAIREGSLQGIVGRLGNVLENVTVEAHPVIAVIKERMLQGGALGSLMSGSGPTVFGIFESRQQAEAVACRIGEEKLAKQIFVTQFVGNCAL